MNNTFRNLPLPTPAEVDTIAALSDPVLRNLQITQCYHELSALLLERTGSNANWCTFATWASKQAGRSIRKEDLARALETILASLPAAAPAAEDVALLSQRLGAKRSKEEIYRTVWQSLNLFKAIEQTSEAVGEGNKKVFEEIGREFARFFAACLDDPSPDPEKIRSFCDELRPGDPPDGQRYLSQAFAHLYEAFFEADAKRGAELVLLANIEIGYHEQTRLQPEIQAALDAPFLQETQFLRRFLGSLFPQTTSLILLSRLVLMRMLGRPPALELAVRALLNVVRSATRQLITETLMTISIAEDIRLRLWRDLSGDYPAPLRQLTHPDLCSLLEAIDPTRDSLSESGTVDWSSLPDRLHFIADLFRLYQQNEALFEPPFTADQTAAFKEGRIPDGRL
jgi:hypothetical protein